MKRLSISVGALVALAWAGAGLLSAAEFDVTNFGAKGDGKTQNREAINRAIEAAARRFSRCVGGVARVWPDWTRMEHTLIC